MEDKPKVFLWKTMRSVSTAFERSIRTLDGGKVFHSPYHEAFHHGAERSSSTFMEEPIRPNCTYRDINEKISRPYEDCAFVFANVSPRFIVDRFEQVILHEGLKNFKHSFLIRDPHKAVPSLYRVLGRHFSADRKEYREMSELYDFIVKNLNIVPTVIDTDDLLENPQEMMCLYCEHMCLPYDENMTRWEPGDVDDWRACSAGKTGWHEDVIKSSGFIRKQNKEGVVSDLYYENDAVRKVIDENISYYNALYEKRLRLA